MHERRGKRRDAECALPVERAFERSEVEQLVFNDGSADGAAKLIDDPFLFILRCGEEIGARFQVLVEVVFVGGAVQGVGAALDLHVDGRAAGETLFSIEAIGDDADGLNRIHGRYVAGDVWEPGMAGGRAIDAEVCGL